MTTLYDQQKPKPVTLELFLTGDELRALYAGEDVLLCPLFLSRVGRLFGERVEVACRNQQVGLVVVPQRPRRADRFRWLN